MESKVEKKDLFYTVTSELNIENETKLLASAELDLDNLPSINSQITLIDKIKKQRD